jgi:hypothetical protein
VVNERQLIFRTGVIEVFLNDGAYVLNPERLLQCHKKMQLIFYFPFVQIQRQLATGVVGSQTERWNSATNGRKYASFDRRP